MNYEHESWAQIYDQFNHGRHEKEREFYRRQLQGIHGPILEVACGTGMILLDYLKEGMDIYGFDLSAEMLAVLHQKAERMGMPDIQHRISHQNMVDFSYHRKFDAIFIPARSFLHLTTQEEQIDCLRTVRAHLSDNGVFMLNFFNPSLRHLIASDGTEGEYSLLNSYAHPQKEGEKIDVYYRQDNEIASQRQSITWRFRSTTDDIETSMLIRWIYHEEFKLLLRLAGFSHWQCYGDFDGAEYTSTSPEMIWTIYA